LEKLSSDRRIEILITDINMPGMDAAGNIRDPLVSADPINPQLVAWELSPRLPDRVVVTSNSSSCALR
jgi:CheY-like chemotaxis protein